MLKDLMKFFLTCEIFFEYFNKYAKKNLKFCMLQNFLHVATFFMIFQEKYMQIQNSFFYANAKNAKFLCKKHVKLMPKFFHNC